VSWINLPCKSTIINQGLTARSIQFDLD